MMVFPLAASLPYFIFFIILLGYQKFKSGLQILFLIFIPYFLALFTYTGDLSDWRTYRNFVNSCNSIGCTYFEPLFDMLTFLSSQTFGFYLIPVFSMLLQFIVFLKIRNYTENKTQYFIVLISIALVYFPLYYGALRQSISFSLLILSILYLYDSKYFKSILFVIIATGFHLSSFVVFTMFIVYYFIWKISNNSYRVFLLLIFLSYIVGIHLMQLFINEFILIDSFNPGTTNATEDSTKSLLLPLERISVLIMALYVLRFFKSSKIFLYIVLCSISGALSYLIIYQFSLNTAGRVVAFFRIADIFIIYYFFKIILSKNKSSIAVNNLNNIAISMVLIYSLVKYYFTIVSVGFFA